MLRALLIAFLWIKARGATAPLLKCGFYGFTTGKSRAVLLQSLPISPSGGDGGFGALTGEEVTVVNVDEAQSLQPVGLALHSQSSSSVASDVCIVYATASKIKLNDVAVLLDLQRAFSSVLAAEDVRSVVVLLDGARDKDEEERCKVAISILAEESWKLLLDKAAYRSDDLRKEVSFKVVSAASAGALLGEVIGSLAQGLADGQQGRSLEGLFPSGDGNSVSGGSRDKTGGNVGLEEVQDAIVAALTTAQEAAQASSAKLQKAESAQSFPVFVENLVTMALGIFSKNAAAHALAQHARAEQEIRRQIFSMLLPFYRRHVQLARVEVAKAFNAAVGEDLAVTIHLMVDLEAEKRRALAIFKQKCDMLRPRGAPVATWNAGFDQRQLQESLDEYVTGREAQAKLLGVLPRGRRPIDVSMHYFLTHPLGRDYRQDPLTMLSGDKPVFLGEGVGDAPSVSALKARAMLSRKAQEGSSGAGVPLSFFEARRAQRDGEFAREMLMLPLSIKNPAVPLMAGRGKKKSSVAAAVRDPNRETLGPERFLRWDLPTLKEAKQGLDDVVRGQVGGGEEEEEDEEEPSLRERAIKLVPGIYNHPPINHGKRLRSSTNH